MTRLQIWRRYFKSQEDRRYSFILTDFVYLDEVEDLLGMHKSPKSAYQEAENLKRTIHTEWMKQVMKALQGLLQPPGTGDCHGGVTKAQEEMGSSPVLSTRWTHFLQDHTHTHMHACTQELTHTQAPFAMMQKGPQDTYTSKNREFPNKTVPRVGF